MKLNISYPTKDRNYITPGTFKFVSKDAELEPVRIYRSPCGTGTAANRYYYQAEFLAPSDAEFVRDGKIRVNIKRDINPFFKPKELMWEGNIAEISE